MYILVIVLMILLSAFFSASEIAFNASNKLRLKKAAESGEKAAALAYKISEDFTTALSAILIGNNLANIAASTAATVLTMRLLLGISLKGGDSVASVISTVVMTLLILIFGEIVPKILAKNNADRAVRVFAYPTKAITLLFFPLVWLVMKLIHLLTKLWGKDAEDAPTVTEEELSSIIETVEEEGVIDEDQSELLQSTLDFRDTTVEEIMTHRIDVDSIDITDPPEKIENVLENSRYSRIPVYEDSVDNVIGILPLHAYFKARLSEEKPDLRKLLLPVCFLHQTVKLPQALSLMRERKNHLAIVVDEFGGTYGIITMEDILEELVGDIWDETDEFVPELVKTGDNAYTVLGDMNIDDFFSELEFDPHDFECEYSTVGGWAIEMLDSDPHVGDSFDFSERSSEEEVLDEEEPYKLLHVTVTAMDDMRVTELSVLLETIAPTEEE